MYTYGQSGCRRYSSVIGEALGDVDWGNLHLDLEAVVVAKSISHHHRHSFWRGGSRRGAYGDTGIMETDWATGSIDLGDPGVDRHHFLIRNTHSIFPSCWSHALLLSFDWSTQFVWFLTHSFRAFIDPHNLCGSSWPGSLSHLWARTAQSHKFPLDVARGAGECWWSALCFLALLYHHTVIEPVSRCTLTPWLSEFGDALGGHDRANFEVVAERVWRCTWSPWSIEIGVFGGGPSGGGRSGGWHDRGWNCIQRSTYDCGNVESWVQQGLPRDEWLAGSIRQSILGSCSSRCMQ